MTAYKETAAQINTIDYLVPIGALLLLFVFADTTIERPDFLIIGAALVLLVNITLIKPKGGRAAMHKRHGMT